MNDNIAKLIETLAAKLGTTAEYLWAVLLKQAYVNATYSLVWLVIAIVYLVCYQAIVRAILKKERERKSAHKDTYYYDWNDGHVFLMISCSVVALIALIAVMALPSGIITGYMNPEYWALQHILEQL